MQTFRTMLALALVAMAAAYLYIILSPALLVRAIGRQPRAFALGVLAMFAIDSPAWAQAATVLTTIPPTSQTLLHIPQPMWDEINQLLIGLVLALLLMGWKWIDSHSPLKGTQAEAIARDAFTSLLCNGAKFGLTQLNSTEKKVGDIDVGNAAVAAAANYVIAQGPGMAAKLGYDVTTQDGRAAIIRMVTSRVGDLMTPEGAAPASLPLPAAVQPPSTPPAPAK